MDITTPQRLACFLVKCLVCGTYADSIYTAVLYDELPALTRENVFRPERNEHVYQFDPCGCRFVPGHSVMVTLHFDRNLDEVPESMRTKYYGTSRTPVTLIETTFDGLGPAGESINMRLPAPPSPADTSGAECCAPERNRR